MLRSGRPRNLATHDAVLAAAATVLGERGYAGFAFEAVAARAGVGKATLYRWWPGRAALATDAFFAATFDDIDFPGRARAADDFRAQVKALAAVLRSDVGAGFAAMIAGARHDAVIAAAIGDRWINVRRLRGHARLRAAQAAGECAADLDIDAALVLFYGPLYSRFLMGGRVPDDAAIDAWLDLAFNAVFVAG